MGMVTKLERVSRNAFKVFIAKGGKTMYFSTQDKNTKREGSKKIVTKNLDMKSNEKKRKGYEICGLVYAG